MAYSELIKNFNKIRAYMRQFYVYGFRTRDEYDEKSARSYDNERRRIESWLGDYMSFRQELSGKVSFISVDSAAIRANPLFSAFKAKSFTSNDIVLNFFILDILQPGVSLGVSEITDVIDEKYMSCFDEPKVFDEATVRNKLNEYEKTGILTAGKDGRRKVYSRSTDTVELEKWKDAAAFFSETDPVGVIGSFLLDKMHEQPDLFSYKHHYILHALESDIICELLDAITDDCFADITVDSKRKGKQMKYKVLPLKICISTDNGRGYLLGSDPGQKRFNMYRLDRVLDVRKEEPAPQKAEVMKEAEEFISRMWNTSSGNTGSLEHLEMTLHIDCHSMHILHRLEREGRHGIIEKIGEDTYRYEIDVHDAAEMRPWLRTFTGRIESLKCSNPKVTEVFYEDLDAMFAMYDGSGGDEDAV